MSRILEQGVEINMMKPAADSEMPIVFPIQEQPESISILLIDEIVDD
jgi:predicted metal-binding protein